jgi:hypothetical protein
MSHLVERLELEIGVADEALGRQLMDRLSRLQHRALTLLLARVMDQLSPPGCRHRIDRLELDLGTFAAADLERELPRALERALLQALPPLLLRSSGTARAAEDPPSEQQHPPLVRAAGTRRATDAAPAGPSPDDPPPAPSRPLELLAWFALRGTLPWWAPRDSPQLIEAAIEAALALPANERGKLLRQLAGPLPLPLPAEGPALQRLLRAAGEQQRPRLQQALQEALPGGAEAMQRAADNPAESRPLELLAWFALRGTLPWWAPRDTPQLIEAAIEVALDLPTNERDALLRQLAGPAPLPLPAEGPALQRLLRAAGEQQRPRLQQALQEALAAPARQRADAAVVVVPPAAPTTPEDGLFVEGAGLVLLWPFLETLLRRLALLQEDGQFCGAEERLQAVALLGFLVDGDPRPPEWRLSLAKLLGGLALEEPGALEEPLDAAAQGEAMALLQAALAHGEGSLGDDLPTLRERWLQRPGWLEPRPGCWLLRVEQRDGDALLEALPWRWDWIRLPWMAELLQVAW